MDRNLNRPIIIHWCMNGNDTSGQVDKESVARKIIEAQPIKVRFINPRSPDDWMIIKSIEQDNSFEIQIEYEFSNYNVEDYLDINSEKKFVLFAKFSGRLDKDGTSHRLIKMIKNYDKFKVIFYISSHNISDSVNFINKVYSETQQGEFVIKPDKSIKNQLINVDILHKAIVEISNIYMSFPEINLSVYDEEKIIRDIVELPYYMYGNMYITENGDISMYSFLPAYNYGVSDKLISLTEAWNKLCTEHGKGDLSKILEVPRYWFKTLTKEM
ncbi:hypothetical protein [Clostridium sp. BNL1100]|uniref:hypothetical protein n=1 Tax=Clostridium sp. BNL1100 TaxID=755731 RepID=UPI00024A71BB|nr:hypothetical protein [Clostridium sp. BNL1100]AEY67203.1 hypothetical protein Clo1100_3055 [Clostridium sp. BNL1100]